MPFHRTGYDRHDILFGTVALVQREKHRKNQRTATSDIAKKQNTKVCCPPAQKPEEMWQTNTKTRIPVTATT